MRRCDLCKDLQPLTEFNKNKAKPGGIGTVCRTCSKARSATYYADNREAHCRVASDRKKRVIDENRQRILAVLERGCMDCPVTDVRVLEFDHRDPTTKARGVSQMLSAGCSWPTIAKEIEKCDVVCANCHKIRTSTMFPNYRTPSSTGGAPGF